MAGTEVIVTLVVSGIVVGFVNTLAAGATIISMTVFMALGLPVIEASGTNRIPVVLQNLVSSLTFRRRRILDLPTALRLSVPTAIGFLIGAQFTMRIGNEAFNLLFGTALLGMAAFLFLRPGVWLKGREGAGGRVRIRPLHYGLLLLSGVYGGSVYVGLGYFLLAIAVVGLGCDLIRANAVKGFLALVCTPVSLAVFMAHGQVNYTYGLIHAVGNILGAWVASRYAVAIGTKFIRWLLIFVILISVLNTFGIVDINACLRTVVGNAQ